jgi:hypothetical protein
MAQRHRGAQNKRCLAGLFLLICNLSRVKCVNSIDIHN